ncbi:unnamed protein product [Meganyctiphanes norvegica]|uniref:Uncharacterized protein n=1 Tax=Meganyctiphanes norvegica TaxID=48144 RepID=A0AAV2R5I0_MEGNR
MKQCTKSPQKMYVLRIKKKIGNIFYYLNNDIIIAFIWFLPSVRHPVIYKLIILRECFFIFAALIWLLPSVCSLMIYMITFMCENLVTLVALICSLPSVYLHVI